MKTLHASWILTYLTVVACFVAVIIVPSSYAEELSCSEIEETLLLKQNLKYDMESRVSLSEKKGEELYEEAERVDAWRTAANCELEGFSSKYLHYLFKENEKADTSNFPKGNAQYLMKRAKECLVAHRLVRYSSDEKTNLKNLRVRLKDAEEDVRKLERLAEAKKCSKVVTAGSPKFDLNISIGSLQSVFVPESIVTANNSEFKAGIWELKGIVGISFKKNAQGDEGVLAILLDPRQIGGPGTYSFKNDESVFERKDGAACLMFSSHHFKDNDEYKIEVAFVSTSGKINLTAFNKKKGGRLTATFSAAVSGERVTGIDKNGNEIYETITGSISGSFDSIITNSYEMLK